MARQSLKSDPAARQRMLDAQRAETTALAAACEAQRRVEREMKSRDAAVAEWDSRVNDRRRAAGEAAAALIAISGRERSATLLGVSSRELAALVRLGPANLGIRASGSG